MEGQSFTIITPLLLINVCVWESLVISKGDWMASLRLDPQDIRQWPCVDHNFCVGKSYTHRICIVETLAASKITSDLWSIFFCWYDHSSRFSTEKTGINGACFIFVQPRVILITVSYPSPQAKRLLVDASKGQDHLMSWFLHFGEAETNMYHDGLTLEVFHYVQKPGVRMIKHGCIERLQGEGLLHSVFILIFGVVLHVESWEFVNWYADRPGVIQIHEWQRLQCKSRFFAHFKSCLISIARILDNGLASLRGRWGRASPSLYLFALKSWHLLGMIFTKIGKVELGETPTNTLLWSYW